MSFLSSIRRRQAGMSGCEAGMTTQMMVLVAVCVAIAVTAGVTIYGLTRSSGEHAEQRLAREHLSYQTDCPAPRTSQEGPTVGIDGIHTLTSSKTIASGVSFTATDTLGGYLTQGLVEADHGTDLNFDGELSDQPINQVYLTTKTSDVYNTGRQNHNRPAPASHHPPRKPRQPNRPKNQTSPGHQTTHQQNPRQLLERNPANLTQYPRTRNSEPS